MIRSMKKALSAPLLTATLLSLTLSGCGHSEEEWQAQLDKYNKLSSANAEDKKALEEAREEVEDTKQAVLALKKQLEEMGMNLDELSSKYQAAGTEKEQLAQNLEELREALEEYKRRAAQLEKIKARYDELSKKLKKLTDLGLKVEIRHNRMVIRLPGDVLYASGSDKLQTKGEEVVGAVADVIRKDETLRKRYFQVAGHTDDRPLKGGRFGDNWGLSAMRARTVLLFLVGQAGDGGGGLDPVRLHAAGYGDIDPVATNETKEGRGQNRRVELVLMPDVEEMLNLKDLTK